MEIVRSMNSSPPRRCSSRAFVCVLSIASVFSVGGCRTVSRTPRPTVLAFRPPDPPPPPERNEVRLEAVELSPNAREPIEVPPGNSLSLMARRALDAAQPDLIRCYESVLPSAADATGSLEIQLDFREDGTVSRSHIDHSAEHNIDRMVPCVRELLNTLRVRDVNPIGQYVSRVYTFRNPPQERTVSAQITVHAPPPAPRPVRRRRGAPPPPPPPAPTVTTPAPGPGLLRDEEISRAISEHLVLRECYGTLLRRSPRLTGTATVTLQIDGTGSVTQATTQSTVAGLARGSSCMNTAFRSLPIRRSGIVHTLQATLLFRR